MISHQFKIREEKRFLEKINFNLEDVTLKNCEVREIDSITARNIVVEYEWLRTMPLFIRYCFGIYFNINNEMVLGGVVVYSDEYSANKSIIWDKYAFTNKILLLSRGVCLWWTPKNTASYFINKTIKWVKKNTEFKIITATVDPAAGEIGTIYQALNWHYVGLMSGNYSKSGSELKRFSVFINGKLRHSRSVRKEFGTIKMDVILNKYPDAIFFPQYRKRRYFYFIGNKGENTVFYSNIKHLILPYPKRGVNVSGIIYMITNLINSKKYIGQTTRGFNLRVDEYKKGVSCSPYVFKAIKKYGWDNFKFEVIETVQTLHELDEKEIFYIKKYDTTNRNLGYNIEYGGHYSISNPETIERLSKIRKEIKQNADWVEKRTKKLSKAVLKINLKTNEIIEEYSSLVVAGKNNKDGLSYSAIQRKCVGNGKNKSDFCWCYKDDYISNKLPNYNKKDIKCVDEFSNKVLDDIYQQHMINNVSIRCLSKEHNINFSTLLKYINKRNRKPNEIDLSNKYILTCKKTGKMFYDHLNSSGALTNHIKETYPEIILQSKFLRKKTELETGLPWYYNYFTFNQIN